MRSNTRRAIWPFMAILAVLFVLSTLAPSGWHKLEQQPVEKSNVMQFRAPQSAAAPHPAEIVRPVAVNSVSPSTDLEPLDQEPFMTTAPRRAEIAPKVTEQKFNDAAAELARRPTQPTRSITLPDEAATSPVSSLLPPTPTPEPAAGEVHLDGVDESTAETSIGATLESQQPDAVPAVQGQPESARAIPAQPAAASPVAIAVLKPVAKPRYLPLAILARLDELTARADCGDCCEQMAGQIRQMLDAGAPTDDSRRALMEIERLLPAASALADRMTEPAAATELRRVQYAVARRMELWQYTLAARSDNNATASIAEDRALERLSACLDAVSALTTNKAGGADWQQYLMLQSLRSLPMTQDAASASQRQAAAKQLLERLTTRRLNEAQRKFVGAAPVAGLTGEVRSWLASSVDQQELLSLVEEYEANGLASTARQVANARQILASSPDSAQQRLAETLDNFYRNANVRLTVNAALLNRLVPQPPQKVDQISETVVGVPVQGHSVTSTRLFVRLLPDRQRLRLGFEASGTVNSRTSASSGPATFVNQGESKYMVRKLLMFGQRGLKTLPAVADADTSSDVESLTTDYDGLPLLSNVVRNIAMNKQSQLQDEAERQVEQRVAATASQRVDAEMTPRMAKLEGELDRRVVKPLEHLDLEPTAITLETTKDRLLMRYRLAAPEQLGANTPRPQAPSDSWMSMQLHESAINNGLENLNLTGRLFTLQELHAWIAERLSRPDAPVDEDLPTDVQVKFADDAVLVRFDGDQVELTLSIAELKQGKNRWTNFRVRTFYKPEIDGLKVQLVRSGPIELVSEKYQGRAQVTLRGVFSKALSHERKVHLTPVVLDNDPRLKDLSVSQCQLASGWLALAISPDRTAKAVKPNAAVTR